MAATFVASFDTNQARRHLLEESQNVAALQLAADDHLAVSINAMDLKNRLRDIETDCPPNRGSLKQRPHPWHSRAGWRSRPQHRKRTSGPYEKLVAMGQEPT